MTTKPIPLATRRPRSGLSRLANHALTVAAVLGVTSLLAALLLAATGVTPLIFRSGSMSPTISTGSLALARSVHTSQLAVGDVVSVHDAQGVRVTHRVVELTAGQLFLQGDANTTRDAVPYKVASADRVFFSTPHVGSVLSAVTNPIGRGLLFVVIACVALTLIRPGRNRATPGSPPGSRGKERAAVVVALLVVAGVGVGVARAPQGTSAFWADSVQASATITIAGLGAPGDFRCKDRTYFSNVTLSWTAVPLATSYTLEVSSLDGNVVRTVPNLTGTSVILDTTNLADYKSYRVTLSAVRTVGGVTTTSPSAGPVQIWTRLLFNQCD